MSEEANMKRVFLKAVREVATQPPINAPMSKAAKKKKHVTSDESDVAKAVADDKNWEHDLYVEEEQGPKTEDELIKIYGYDIRKGPAPKDNSSSAKLSFFQMQTNNSKIRNKIFKFRNNRPSFTIDNNLPWTDFDLESDKENLPDDDELTETHTDTVDTELSNFMSAICLKPRDEALEKKEPSLAVAAVLHKSTTPPIACYPPKENSIFLPMNSFAQNPFETEHDVFSAKKLKMIHDPMDIQPLPQVPIDQLFLFMNEPKKNVFHNQDNLEIPMEIQN